MSQQTEMLQYAALEAFDFRGRLSLEAVAGYWNGDTFKDVRRLKAGLDLSLEDMVEFCKSLLRTGRIEVARVDLKLSRRHAVRMINIINAQSQALGHPMVYAWQPIVKELVRRGAAAPEISTPDIPTARSYNLFGLPVRSMTWEAYRAMVDR